MARKGRTLLRALLIIIGVFVVAVVALMLLVPRDAIRERVLARIEAETGRPVNVAAVQVGLFPSPHVTLRDLEIGEAREQTGPRVSARVTSLSLQTRLLPLLRRRVEVTRIHIDEPRLQVHLTDESAAAAKAGGADARAAAGTPPSPPTTEPDAQEQQPASSSSVEADEGGARSGDTGAPVASSPVDIQVQELTIRGGRIQVYHPDGAPFVSIGGLAERLSATATSAGLFTLEGETLIDTLRVHLPAGVLGRDLPVRLRKELTYDTARDLFTIREATLQLGDLPVAVTGSLSRLTGGAPVADLKLAGGPASVGSILGYLPDAMFPYLEGLRSQGTLTLAATVGGALPQPSQGSAPQDPRAALRQLPAFTVDLTLADGRIDHPQLPAPVEDLALELHAEPDTVEVRDFTARSGASRLRARVTVAGVQTQPGLTLGLDADVDLRDVSALQADPDSLRMTGRAVAQLVVSGPADRPAELVPVGTLQLQDAAAEGLLLPVALRDLSGQVTLRRGELLLEAISGRVGRSDLRLDGTLTNYMALDPEQESQRPVGVDLRLQSELLDLDELRPPPAAAGGDAPSRRPRGQGTGTGEKDAPPPTALLGAMVGSIRMQVDELHVNGAVARDTRGTVKIDRGVFDLEGLATQAFGGNLAAKGRLDYRNPESPHFDMQFQVKQVQASQLYGYAQDLNRFANLGGFLNGEIDATAQMQGDLDDSLGLELQTLSSVGSLQTHGASITGHPLQNALVGYLDAPRLEKLSISDWVQPFRIQNGRLVVDGMNLKADQVEVSATGWQALDGGVAMSLEVLLPQELSDGLRAKVPAELAPILFDGSSERLLVPLEISGRLPKPKIGLNTDKLRAGAQRRAEQRLAMERERLEQQALEQAGDFLQDLLGSEKDSTQQQDAQEKGKEVEKQVKDLLKGLFKKK